MAPVAVVDIAARYGLEGSGFKPPVGGGENFPTQSIPTPRLNQAPIELVNFLFPGSKEAGTWRLSPSRAEVKEKVQNASNPRLCLHGLL
jgi:hypothetical protein